ncbi:unnamed protein product [Camellia sinensis]
MESNGGDASTILRELENLKSSKIEIEPRISVLEAQLRQKEDETKVNSTSSCTPVSDLDLGGILILSGKAGEVTVIIQTTGEVPVFVRNLRGGQSNLLKTSILVVGAGGLGSPALLYLAACGVGRLGIVDHDIVELNDLHRQIIRTVVYIGQSKVESAAAACRLLYDIAIDATDNAPRRYLISDCCVVLGKPLVSGAAVGLEGQTVVVPGIIGCFQALEARKIASAIGEPLSGRMLLMHCLPRFVLVKIRGRSLQCEKFTKSPFFMAEARISSKEFNERIVKGEAHVLLDVRPAHHFKIVSLPKSMNIPLSSLAARLPEISSALKQEEPMEVILAIEYLRKMGFASAKDIVGGLESWAHDVDPNFTTY